MCVPPRSAALSSHGGGGDADTCVCRLQSAHRSPRMTAETRQTRVCVARRNAQRFLHMMAETRLSHACAARRSAERSPHMVTETRRTRVCVPRRGRHIRVYRP